MTKQTKNSILFKSEDLGIKVEFVFINKKLTKSEEDALKCRVWDVCKNLFICNFKAMVMIIASNPEVESMLFKIRLKFDNLRYIHDSNYINTPSTFLVAGNALDNLFDALKKLSHRRVLIGLAEDLKDPKV